MSKEKQEGKEKNNKRGNNESTKRENREKKLRAKEIGWEIWRHAIWKNRER